ncbi:Transcriptional regulatory protein DesR [Burkholderiales bacterium]|nr:Transcriptional regulatory protein DesR [Burkholderiales bacterium]
MPLRVFLVEDNPAIRERLIESLTATGSIDVVGHAETERQAVEALSDGSWDAVLLDLQLKQGTGLGVLRAIAPSRPLGAKILVLTTYAIPQYRDRSLALGADAFFDKSQEYERAVDMLSELARSRSAPA